MQCHTCPVWKTATLESEKYGHHEHTCARNFNLFGNRVSGIWLGDWLEKGYLSAFVSDGWQHTYFSFYYLML